MIYIYNPKLLYIDTAIFQRDLGLDPISKNIAELPVTITITKDNDESFDCDTIIKNLHLETDPYNQNALNLFGDIEITIPINNQNVTLHTDNTVAIMHFSKLDNDYQAIDNSITSHLNIVLNSLNDHDNRDNIHIEIINQDNNIDTTIFSFLYQSNHETTTFNTFNYYNKHDANNGLLYNQLAHNTDNLNHQMNDLPYITFNIEMTK